MPVITLTLPKVGATLDHISAQLGTVETPWVTWNMYSKSIVLCKELPDVPYKVGTESCVPVLFYKKHRRSVYHPVFLKFIGRKPTVQQLIIAAYQWATGGVVNAETPAMATSEASETIDNYTVTISFDSMTHDSMLLGLAKALPQTPWISEREGNLGFHAECPEARYWLVLRSPEMYSLRCFDTNLYHPGFPKVPQPHSCDHGDFPTYKELLEAAARWSQSI